MAIPKAINVIETAEALNIIDDVITCEIEWSDNKETKDKLQKAWNKIIEELTLSLIHI